MYNISRTKTLEIFLECLVRDNWIRSNRMIKLVDFEKVARETYLVKISCLSLVYKGEDANRETSFQEYQDKLKGRLALEPLISEIFQGNDSSDFRRKTIAKGIGSHHPFNSMVEILNLYNPIGLTLNYDLEAIDPEYCKNHVCEHLMKGSALYDGFLYYTGTQVIRGSFNYQRHNARLTKWLENILCEKGCYEIQYSSHSPPIINIHLFLLNSVPEGESFQEYAAGIKYELTLGNRLYFSYLCDPDESTGEAIREAMHELYFITREMFTHYFSCQVLDSIYILLDEEVMNGLGEASDQYLEFYDISSINIFSRFRKCMQIGRTLANIYTLMPNIENIRRYYDEERNSIKSETESESDNPLPDILTNLVVAHKEIAFTQAVNEMLRQEVSDIRSQVNYQILLITAFIAFVAVVGSALIGLFG